MRDAGSCEGLFTRPSGGILCPKKLSKRTVALHDLEELDDDLRGRADQDLALAGLLGVVDVVESIVQDGGADHFGGCGGWSRWEILKSLKG